MNGLNRIFLLGRLGNDPEMFTSTKGQQYTGLSLATDRVYESGEEGKKTKTTDWHYVRVWGKAAQSCAKFLSKGQAVLVEGYLTQYAKNKSADEPSGRIERKVSINAIRVDFLPRASINEPKTPE